MVARKRTRTGAALLLLIAAGAANATQGTWTAAPSEPVNGGPAFGLWLLTDGSVLSHSNALNNWCKLVPGPDGNYADGTWVQLASGPFAMGGAEEHILNDGRFIETGSEYLYVAPSGWSLSSTNQVQIYDPALNWWVIGPQGLYGDIGDTGSAILGDGRLFGSSRNSTSTEIYNPATNAWTSTAAKSWNTGDEEAWFTLQNGEVFSVGSGFDGNAYGGIYDVGLNTWQQFPAPSTFKMGDAGPCGLLPSGSLFCTGLGGVNAIFTPGTSPQTGTWKIAGSTPNAEETEDAYGCVEPNSYFMYYAYPTGGAVNLLCEYNPTTDTVASITPPPDSASPWPISFVNLPNGQIMTCGGSLDWLYTPVSGPNPAWAPVVTGVSLNSGGTVAINGYASGYKLYGYRLSGVIGEGEEGDDMSGDENYPIVWLKNSAGQVYYCKSFNFSTRIPSKSGSTASQNCSFNLPAGVPAGNYSLYVSSVGIRSVNAYPFTVPGQTHNPSHTEHANPELSH